MVDRDRTRLVVDIALTVNGQSSDTLVSEQAGRDGACGAVTDHDNFKIAAVPF
jgi:hypothetical protein